MRLSRFVGRLRQGRPRVLLALAIGWFVVYVFRNVASHITTQRAGSKAQLLAGSVDHGDGCVELIRSQSRHYSISGTRCMRREEIGPNFEHSSVFKERLLECERPAVAWDAPLAGGLTFGLSSEAVSFLVPLADHVDITLAGDFRSDSTFVASLDPNERQLLKKLKAMRHARVIPNHAGVYVSQWAPGTLWWNKLREFAPADTVYRISRAMYEATHVPSDWPPNFKEIDEFWVPFAGMKDILVKNHGVTPERIFVIEEGLDTVSTFNPSLFDRTSARKRIYPSDVQDTFIFLSVFKWEERKAYKELIQAFSKAFPLGNESVSLFLRTTPSESIEGVVKRYADREDLRIRILPTQDEHRYQQMLVSCDAFVLASHGEGWGRPIMEGSRVC